MQTSLPKTPSEAARSMKHKCEHQADCLKFIQMVLDGAGTEQDLDRLQRNLASCEPCIQMYNLEKEVKALLQNRMEKRCCPEQIISNIRSQLAAFS